MTKEREKRNGFEIPYDELQVTSWILFPVLALYWFVGVLPCLRLLLKICLSVPFVSIFVLCAYFAFETTKTDAKDTNFTNAPSLAALPGDVKKCYICEKEVASLTMHCRLCRKCIDGFDHHCKWLNTCIGQKNYKAFFRTLSCATGIVVIEWCVCFWLFFAYFTQPEALSVEMSLFWGKEDIELLIWFIVLCSFLFMLTPIGFLLLQLWLFHVELLRKQITTYEYLKDLERRKREKGRVVKKHPNISSEKGAIFPMQFNDSTHKSSSIYKRSILRSVFFCFTTEISNIVIDHPTNINLQANIVNRQEV